MDAAVLKPGPEILAFGLTPEEHEALVEREREARFLEFVKACGYKVATKLWGWEIHKK